MSLTPFQSAMIDYCRIAFHKGASDIHIEPERDRIKIRLRIDGKLRHFIDISEHDATIFAEQIKELLRFNMTISGLPQDSSYSHPYESVDFRCNITPVRYGEKIVLRLLERGKDFHLNNYPLYEGPKNDLINFIDKSQGLIIVSGPTGSGKSTLLYSALGTLDRDSINIHTVEDPIEYALSGINQTQINLRKDLSFARTLPALMRQDPDVIMIGEVRDQETAKAAIHAASTGHLVFTTVHANDAKGIITRMLGFGIIKEHIDSALLFASAQRLAKVLCPHCKTEAPEDLKLLSATYPDEPIDFAPMKAMGCNICAGKGVKGRVLLFEYIKRDERVIDGNAFISNGNLRQAAFVEIKNGNISVAEARRQFM